MLRHLWQASIWHPDAIDVDEWKNRHNLRIWLPLYDLVAVGAGVWATLYGSPILLRLFPPFLVEVAGSAMAFTAFVCLLGIAFPKLWSMELAAKLGIVFLLGCYAGTVAFFPTNPDASNGFVVFILALAMIPAFGRVTDLADKLRAALTDRKKSR